MDNVRRPIFSVEHLKSEVETIITGKFGNFDGGGNDGMEARIARLEASVEAIQRDVKETKDDLKNIRNIDIQSIGKKIDHFFIFIISLFLAGFGTVLYTLANGFGWIGK